MVLFVFQYSIDCNFGKFNNFRIGTVRSEKVKPQNVTVDSNIFHYYDCDIYWWLPYITQGFTESHRVNKQHHSKVLPNSFAMNGHTLGFCP